MTTTEQPVQAQPEPVNLQALTYGVFDGMVKTYPSKKATLTFEQWSQREQVRLLRSINDKLGFFVILIILGIIVSIFQTLGR